MLLLGTADCTGFLAAAPGIASLVGSQTQDGTVTAAGVNGIVAKAMWNVVLVQDDASRGVHNPSFSLDVLTFAGRLKRFIKLGGEMISLPAIEDVLVRTFFTNTTAEGPVLAVEATLSDTAPELVLFVIQPIAREAANQAIREAGLSSLHNIRAVRIVEAMPTLGTGKTDYRALKAMLAG